MRALAASARLCSGKDMPRLEALRRSLAEAQPTAAAFALRASSYKRPAHHVDGAARLPARLYKPDGVRALSLMDGHGRQHSYLRVSLAERCNLRCTYCMPAEGIQLTPADQLLSTQQMLQLVRFFVDAGVHKVRLTGGEPTVHPHLLDIVRTIRDMPGVRTVAMTTNGVALSPAKAKALHAAGLSCINISLDTLQRTRFEAVSRRPASYWDATRRAIDAALALPFDSVKLNCVLLRGVNDDELAEFVELTRSQPLHVRFIELMPFGGNAWTSDKFLAAGEAIASLQQRYPSMHPLGVDGTSQRFGIDGHAGSVGFIASMSAAFCATCDRLRLTADGNVRACLHGAHEVPMKHLLEAGDVDGLRAAVRSALGAKHAALGGEAGMHALSRAAQHADARPMIKIGG